MNEDEELRELEAQLRPYRWKGELPPAEALPELGAPWWRRPATLALAVAAGVAFALSVYLGPERQPPAAAPGYRYEVLTGAPRIDGNEASGLLRAGQRLSCGAGTRVEIEIGAIGRVELEPDSSLRVDDPAHAGDPAASHLLFLERGSLYASIFAAPRLFQVGTPAGIAVDLGCMYRATVEPDGSTRLSVESGQVSFERDGRRALVPSGASTVAFPQHGPIAPTWDDAEAEFRAAVVEVDLKGDVAALRVVLDNAREADALTLWHLLQHPDSTVRARVFDRLVALSPPPEGVTRAGCLAGEVRQLETWKHEMGWSW